MDELASGDVLPRPVTLESPRVSCFSASYGFLKDIRSRALEWKYDAEVDAYSVMSVQFLSVGLPSCPFSPPAKPQTLSHLSVPDLTYRIHYNSVIPPRALAIKPVRGLIFPLVRCMCT